MTPSHIIQRAAADGVRLALSPSGTIKAIGTGPAVSRWLPIIREHKPGIVAALQEAANDGNLLDPAAETRRRKVLARLAENPNIRRAVIVDEDSLSESVIVTLAIRAAGTCELRIQRDKWDPFLFLDAVERHCGPVH